MELVQHVNDPKCISFGDDATRTLCAVTTGDAEEAVILVDVRRNVVVKRFSIGENQTVGEAYSVDYNRRYVVRASPSHVYAWDINNPSDRCGASTIA